MGRCRRLAASAAVHALVCFTVVGIAGKFAGPAWPIELGAWAGAIVGALFALLHPTVRGVLARCSKLTRFQRRLVVLVSAAVTSYCAGFLMWRARRTKGCLYSFGGEVLQCGYVWKPVTSYSIREPGVSASPETAVELVLARWKEDLAWVEELPPRFRVTVCDHYDRNAPNFLPNFGVEASCYLRYIVDRYDNLPAVVVFMQAGGQHHNFRIVDWILALRPDMGGWVHLNSDYRVGCCAGRSMNRDLSANFAKRLSRYDLGSKNRTLFDHLSKGPLTTYCCQQFAVSRETLRRWPVHFYQTLLELAMDPALERPLHLPQRGFLSALHPALMLWELNELLYTRTSWWLSAVKNGVMFEHLWMRILDDGFEVEMPYSREKFCLHFLPDPPHSPCNEEYRFCRSDRWVYHLRGDCDRSVTLDGDLPAHLRENDRAIDEGAATSAAERATGALQLDTVSAGEASPQPPYSLRREKSTEGGPPSSQLSASRSRSPDKFCRGAGDTCCLRLVGYHSSEWETLWGSNIREWQNGTVCDAVLDQREQVLAFMRASCSWESRFHSWCLLDDSVQKIWWNTHSGEVLDLKLRDAHGLYTEPYVRILRHPLLLGSLAWCAMTELITGTACGGLKPAPSWSEAAAGDGKIFSHFEYRNECTGATFLDYIEPLVGHLRHPLSHCGWTGDYPYPFSSFHTFRGYIMPTQRKDALEPHRTNMLFDAGSSDWSSGAGGPSLSYLTEVWGRHGIEFGRVEGWDGNTDAKTFEDTVPDVWKERTIYHEQFISGAADTDPFLPTIISETADEEDYVVFKLDIDNSEVEMGVVDYYLSGSERARSDLARVDELLWEQHVSNYIMERWWGKIERYDLQSSFETFLKLRELGVRAHSYV